MRRGALAVRAVLGAACAYVVVSSLTGLISVPDRAPEPGAPAVPPPLPVLRAGVGLERYAVIVERNLFRTIGGMDAPIAPPEERLPETRLPLRLRGTAVSDRAERSLAVVEDSRAGEALLVRVGERIAGARVERIERDRVILRYRGLLELITLPESASSGAGGSAEVALRTRMVITDDPAEEARAAERVRRLRPRPRAAVRDLGRGPAETDDDAIDSPPASPAPEPEDRLVELSQQARFLPEFGDAGELRGIVVTDIREGSTLERIGLRDGDVVLAIGDNRIENHEEVVPALRSLDLASDIAIEIERGGEPQTIDVPGGAL